MKRKEKEFHPPKHRQPFFSFVKRILRVIYRRPQLINCSGEEIAQRAIFVSNHSARRGAVIMELYLPVRNAKWGAYQMLERYFVRRVYLRDVFYRQKCGYGKFRSWLCATLSGIFSIYFYRGMKIMPTYTDGRFAKSVRNSVEVLKDDTAILVFPEDSEEGYKEVLAKFHSGFVVLAETYFRKENTDLPVYPVYYHKKANKLIIGEPEYVQQLKARGLDREGIAAHFCDKVNGLYYEYVKKKL